MLTLADQERLARFLENHPDVAKDVERVVKRELSAMTFQERIEALMEYQEAGRAFWTLHQAYRGHRAIQLDAQGEDENHSGSTERIMRAELEVDEVSSQLVHAKRENDRLRQQLAETRGRRDSNVRS